MKILLKIVIGCVGLGILGFGFLIGYGTLSDYRPEPETLVYESQDTKSISVKEFNIMIWNIGYCGLSSDMDFFYDGGKQVRPSRTIVENNIENVLNFITQQNNIDFFLFQEVDQDSKRSYGINEYQKIRALFPDYHDSFGKNYDVFFVPLPFSKPLGHVLSGLLTLSRFQPSKVVRYSFPGNYAWPQGLFMLDRCFMVNRYMLDNEKELLVINTHNSAYDDGTLRSNQMKFLENFLKSEYKKGNYIVVGGDWNQCPPNFIPNFKKNLMDNENRMDIEMDFLGDWTFVYDKTVPTNRRLPTPYDEKTTLTTVIDFFLVSPNIKAISVKGIDLGFQHADHQPVVLSLGLQ